MGKSESEIQKQHTAWVRILDKAGGTWLITSKRDRAMYFLWKLQQDGYRQVAKNIDPGVLDDLIWK